MHMCKIGVGFHINVYSYGLNDAQVFRQIPSSLVHSASLCYFLQSLYTTLYHILDDNAE